jgi:predicted nucleic acid-binding protein
MVVDTMVFAYALLGVEEFRQDATAILEQADTISVPDSFRVEMTNVLWQWIKHRGVSIETALQVMDDTESLIGRTLSGENLWERALVLSVNSNHPAYDTYFIAAAEMENAQVVSFDKKLKAIFPDKVLTAAEFLSAGTRI